MANEFLEERLSVSIAYGSSWTDSFMVDIHRSAGGAEDRRLIHPIPMRKFSIDFDSTPDEVYDTIVNLYYRVYGQFAGFRAKALDDYTTNGFKDAPTNTDQTLELVSTGVYQLVKEYGTGATGLGIGYPTRTIYKPVASTTVISIVNNSTTYPQTVTTHWTVDTTTGLVTFAANKNATITGITLGATTLISFGSPHTFLVGDSVRFSSIVGTTELNGKRGVITAINTGGDNITVSINSSTYTAWVSGGICNTRPQSGETVKGGCEFDIPVRFNTALDINQRDYGLRLASGIELVELISL